MSGHSKWAQIKRKKEATDQKKGKLITQFAKVIALAARDGADPEHNIKLKLAILRAKSFNIPSDTIDRAIERGSGAKEGEGFSEIVYEAYGPGGTAFIIQTITDNKNRTVSELKHLLSLHGGKMAQSGGVSWMFEDRGVVEVALLDATKAEEAELLAIENNALDVSFEDGVLYIETRVPDLQKLEKVFKDAGYTVNDSHIDSIAKDSIPLPSEAAENFHALCAALEENEDVQNVFTNVA
jgi:YebC/PmpR family DNA-binding regulatory protein